MLHLSLLPFVLFAEHMSLAQLPCHLTAPQEEMALPLLRAINSPDGYSPSLSYSFSPSFLFPYFLILFFHSSPTNFLFSGYESFLSAFFNFEGVWPNLQCHSIIILLAQLLWMRCTSFTYHVYRESVTPGYIKIKRFLCMRNTLPDKY